jgi:hypothetical protein
MQVEINHGVYSSELGGIAVEDPPKGLERQSFIRMEGATPKPGAVRGPMWSSSERSRSGWDGEFESPLLQR